MLIYKIPTHGPCPTMASTILNLHIDDDDNDDDDDDDDDDDGSLF